MSIRRQLRYAWERFARRRTELLADGLPLGLRLWVGTSDDVGRRLYKYRVHEPHVLAWLERQPCPANDALVIDAGANLGWYALLLDRLGMGRLAIHAFEPDPENRALLERNCALNQAQNVTIHASALSNRRGQATLHRYRAINRGKHSLRPLARGVDTVEVETDTLDACLARAGLSDRDIFLLKVDVEGFEPEVIEGAAESLRRVQQVLLEYTPAFLDGDRGAELLDRLFGAGLSPLAWDGGAWSPVKRDRLLRETAQRDTLWVRDPVFAGCAS
ncbi:MAG: FkbM family methyltransferase [Xanthomonadales bacterium]|nr:FkbM family methyltransferase [Xanthomonadales bacterium]